MKTKTIFLAVAGLIITNLNVLADSPLTSTEFNRPYSDEKVVIEAGKGFLNPYLASYLADESNPIDVRMAVINRLGWNTAGTVNDSIFFEYLRQVKGYSDIRDLTDRGTAGELLSMAYLTAMSDYFDVTLATEIAEKAVSKNPGSFTFNIICALIKAQTKLTEFDWCEVYNLTNRVREDSSLTHDMKPEAMARIYEYMDQYREYCAPIND